MSASPAQSPLLVAALTSLTSALSAPLTSWSEGVPLLSSGGKASTSVGVAASLSITTLFSLAGLLQAAIAAATPRTRISLFASRISEARHWVAFGPHQLFP